MSKIKTIIKKNLLFMYLISGIITILALYNLPNLSNLAIQGATPQSELSKNASQMKKHWGNLADNAVPISVTYSVPIEFSKSQKIRLDNKERFLIEHKKDLKIYKITSAYTSPHAQNLFNGKNWRTLQLWIPTQLINQPIYQRQLLYLCKLSGIHLQWHNSENFYYQKLAKQWFQQKIIIAWVFVIFFSLLLWITSITQSFLLTLANLEINLIILSLISNLCSYFFFYMPLITVFTSSTLIISLVLFFHQPRWLKYLHIPMHNWHPLLVLSLLTGLIIPLLSNCHLHFQAPQKNQTITVYLHSPHSITNQSNLNLDHLTKALKKMPNVSRVNILTQPGGQEIPKYQLGTQVKDINRSLLQKQKLTQTIDKQLNQINNNLNKSSVLNEPAEQFTKIQDENEILEHDKLFELLQKQNVTHVELINQLNQTQQKLGIVQNQLKQTKISEELKNLAQIQNQTMHQFYLNNQDAQDSDFNQTCFNYNNRQQNTTRLEIELRDGKLGNLETIIKSHLIGTNFSNKIGIVGVPVLIKQKDHTFQKAIPLVIALLSTSILISNWIKFKSFGFAWITVLLAYLTSAAGIGMLNYLANFQFTPETCYLFLFCTTLLAVFNKLSNALFPTILITVSFLLVSPFETFGLALFTFSCLYQMFLAKLELLRKK